MYVSPTFWGPTHHHSSLFTYLPDHKSWEQQNVTKEPLAAYCFRLSGLVSWKSPIFWQLGLGQGQWNNPSIVGEEDGTIEDAVDLRVAFLCRELLLSLSSLFSPFDEERSWFAAITQLWQRMTSHEPFPCAMLFSLLTRSLVSFLKGRDSTSEKVALVMVGRAEFATGFFCCKKESCKQCVVSVWTFEKQMYQICTYYSLIRCLLLLLLVLIILFLRRTFIFLCERIEKQRTRWVLDRWYKTTTTTTTTNIPSFLLVPYSE